ncbi:MAG: CPBP family intramembrane metalloprotease [Streptococcaceae bacterium]|jgi:membrane protease YdiL (CAAX protease family)|nr:CPBP family intramembrane metalloprotease [Streptococcaceae bacterium]
MENVIIHNKPKKKGNLPLALVGGICLLFGFGILLFMPLVWHQANAKHPAALFSELELLALPLSIVGIVFLSIFSPLRGRRMLWLFFLSQIPLTLLSIIAAINTRAHIAGNWIAITSETLVFIPVLGVLYFLAYRAVRKYNVIPPFSWHYFRWGRAFIGAAMLLGSEFLISFIAEIITHSSGGTSQNQQTLNTLAIQVPYLIYTLTTISAGFFEELLFRVGSFEILLKKHKIWAFIVASVFFTIAHGPTKLTDVFAYGALALILTGFYAKYRNFYLNMTMHMLLNLVATGAFWLSLILHH